VEITPLSENEDGEYGSSEEGYFAALTDAKVFAQEAYRRVEDFENTRQYLMYRWNRNYLFYHNLYYQEGQPQQWGYSDIRYTGENGEFATMSINHFRNLAIHLKNLISNSRIAFQCRAANGDAKSASQAELGNVLLDYYLREGRLTEVVNDAIEHALLFDAGYVKVEWDPEEGKEINLDLETNAINHEGDLRYTSIAPIDIITDLNRKNFRDNDWVIVRTQQSKWNLIARFPEHKEKIEAMNTLEESRSDWDYSAEFSKSDDLYLYEFWHNKTPAMPNGRYALFTEDGNIFYDSPLHYKEIPIYQITAGNHLVTQYGYSPLNDVAGAQEAINMCYSTMLTTLETFGVQNVLAPREAGITIEEVRSGLNFIEYDGNHNPPSGVNFTTLPPELLQFIQKLETAQETISGINSVVRGNPDNQLRSGVSLAIVEDQALNFVSHLHESYIRLYEDIGTASIDILKVYANTQRVFTIVGDGNLAAMQDFRGEDLQNISRVIVDIGSALSRTTAGRIQMAEHLIQTQLIRSPEEYMTVVNTGNLDQLTKGRTGHLQLIHRENEGLLRGQGARSLFTDDHTLHIRKHIEILDDPEVRADDQLANTVLSHVQEHINLLTEPQLQMLFATLGIQSPGLMQMQQAQGGQGGQVSVGSAPDTLQEQAQNLRKRPDIKANTPPEPGVPLQ
jgi:hypothetical protein